MPETSQSVQTLPPCIHSCSDRSGRVPRRGRPAPSEKRKPSDSHLSSLCCASGVLRKDDCHLIWRPVGQFSARSAPEGTLRKRGIPPSGKVRQFIISVTFPHLSITLVNKPFKGIDIFIRNIHYFTRSVSGIYITFLRTKINDSLYFLKN